MPGLLPDVDPQGLLEYSVVYTDRSLNHMSKSFQGVMNDISATLKRVYNAASVIVVPGSGTFGMEAVARQFAAKKKCLVIRNGFFSYRWTQIFDMGRIPSVSIVLKARPMDKNPQARFIPPPIDEVVSSIKEAKPDLVFAPHVETSSGLILPDDYISALSEAVHSVGGLFVLDCVASGTIWVDMEASGVDVLITAPQKGWSGSPCCGLVMLSPLAKEIIASTSSSSFACDLKKWLQIMDAYENGGHAYHATMPTDSLSRFNDVMKEAEKIGFEKIKNAQQKLGEKISAVLDEKGLRRVAADQFQAPGVIVCYTDDSANTVKKFIEQGIQVAGGVPLQCDEPKDFQTFRIGLFGLDKLQNIDRTIDIFEKALNNVLGK